MQQDWGCSNESLGGWLRELQSAGWLRIILGYNEENDPVKKKGGRRPGNKYELLDGHGVTLTEAISKRAPRSGNASAPENGNARTRTQKWERSAPKSRTESHPEVGSEVIPLNSGNIKEPLSDSASRNEVSVSDDANASLDGSAAVPQPSASVAQKGGSCTDKF